MISTSQFGSLVEFAFESTVDAELDSPLLWQIVRQAWRDNMRRGLTGEMRFSGRRVRQVIEGEMDVVLSLASRILSDRRHGAIRVIAFGSLAARRFDDWTVSGIELPVVPAGDAAMEDAGVIAFRHAVVPSRAAPAGQRSACRSAL